MSAPQSGGQSRIEIQPAALNPSGSHEMAFVRNRSLAEKWQPANPGPQGSTITLDAGGGDIIEVRFVDAASGETHVVIGGIVPLPDETQPPEWDAAGVLTRYDSGVLRVDLSPGAIKDASFPVKAELYRASDSNLPPHSLLLTSPSSLAASFALAGNIGERITLRLTDDLGNRAQLHFVIKKDGVLPDPRVAAPDPFPASYRPDGVHADAERTNRAAIAAHGVMLLGGDFHTSVDVLSTRGEILDTLVQLHYRSSLDYDGPVGRSWDWTLDSRLESTPSGYRWYPGDGRVEEGLLIGDSPPGLFLALSSSPSSSDLQLETANGTRMIFSTTTGLLARIEKQEASLRIVRAENGRVVALIDDKARRTGFEWYLDHRLAAITDFGGRRVEFQYDALGNLVRMIRADQSVVEWGYQAGTSLLTELSAPRDPDQARQTQLTNVYGATGRVVRQSDQYSGSSGNAYRISQLNPSGVPVPPTATHVVRVTDPDGSVVDYGLGPLPAGPLVVKRTHLDGRRRALEYPGNPDPDWVEECHGHDPLNLLVSEKYYRDANLPGGQRIELEHWTYLSDSVSSTDPRHRSRLLRHEKIDETGQALLVAEFEYRSNSLWPTRQTSASTAPITFRWNDAGQLLQRWIQDIQSGVELHDIEERHVYDAKGRVTHSWSPNRLHDPSGVFGRDPEASTRRKYYEHGYAKGWLERVEQVDRSGQAILWREFVYDVFGMVTRECNQADHEQRSVYDDLGRVVGKSNPILFTAPGAPPEKLWQRTVWEYDRDQPARIYETLRNAVGELIDPNPILTSERMSDPSADPPTLLTRSAFAMQSGGVQYSEKLSKFTSAGHLASVSSSCGPPSFETTTTSFVYDSAGRLISQQVDPSAIQGDELTEHFEYNAAGREVAHYPPGSQKPRRTLYDALGRTREIVTVPAALGQLQDENGTPGERIVGCFVTTHSYAASDPSQRVTDQHTYSVLGSPRRWADPSARALLSHERYGYDAAGRKVQESRLIEGDLWATTDRELEPGGQTRRQLEPTDDSGRRQFQLNVHDEVDRIEATYDAVGNATVYSYGSSGFVSREQIFSVVEHPSGGLDLSSRSIEYLHDSLGRVIEQRSLPNSGASTAPLIEKKSYDGRGNLALKRHLQTGNKTVHESFEYDLAGNLVSSEVRRHDPRSGVVDELAATHEYRYDHLRRLTDENAGTPRWTQYTYDLIGRTVRIDATNGHKRSFTYDRVPSFDGDSEWSTVEELTSQGVRKKTTYNELGNRLWEDVTASANAAVSGPVRVEFVYAGTPNSLVDCECGGTREPAVIRTKHDLSSVSPGDTIVEREFDSTGRVRSEKIRVRTGSSWRSTTMGFRSDATGRTIEVNYPSGATSSREYRVDGKLRATHWRRSDLDPFLTLVQHYYRGSDESSRICYDESSPPQQILRGDFTYDELGRPSSSEWTALGSVILAEEVLGRDALGQLTARSRSLGGSQKLDRFEYAASNWIVSEEWGRGTQSGSASTRTYFLTPSGEPDQLRISSPSQLWSHHYDDSGHRIAIDGNEVLAERYLLGCEDPPSIPPTCSYYSSWISQRRSLYDLDGNLIQASYDRDFEVDCNQAHLFLANYRHQVQHDFTYDAWGRVIEDRRTGTRTREDLQCPNPTPFQVSSQDIGVLERRSIYDGLGRLVCSSLSGPLDSILDEDLITSGSYADSTYFAYEDRLVVVVEKENGAGIISTQEYYREPESGAIQKGRDVTGPSDVLFTTAQDLNGYTVAGNIGAALNPTFAEPTTFSVDAVNPIGLLIDQEGKMGKPQLLVDPPADQKTLTEKTELWDDDLIFDDLVAKFDWKSTWTCDGGGLRLQPGTLTANAERLDTEINTRTDSKPPTPAGENSFWIIHEGLGTWTEFSWRGAVAGATTGLTAGGLAGVQAGAAAGTIALPIVGTGAGALVLGTGGALIGGIGGLITGGLTFADLRIATTKTDWEISCSLQPDKFVINLHIITGPSRQPSGDLFWKDAN